MFNLLEQPWIPVAARNGERRRIRPAEIVDGLGTDNAPVRPLWPRPDFDLATYELLIGLLFVACPPGSRTWIKRYESPPSVEELDAAFAPFASAFNLNGDGPCFMQDLEPFEDGKPFPIERLLIDSAGESAIRKNSDLLVHRGRYAALDLSTAAIALYALQQFAPAGGAGNRTSMRGGGALTVLALPLDEPLPSLWQVLWANTPTPREPKADPGNPGAFPWLVETRTSENGRGTFPQDAHEAQAFFAMPRRLRLAFRGGEVVGFFQKRHGVNYEKWEHPLSPYYRQTENGELLPRHIRPGRFGYRDWVAATTALQGSARQQAARSLTTWKRERAPEVGTGGGEGRVLIAGWSMNNMEAEDFLVAVRPLHVASDPDAQTALDELAVAMAEAGEAAWSLTRRALSLALLGSRASASDDTAMFESARRTFFERTEDDFHRILAEARHNPLGEAPRQGWLAELRRCALDIFDAWALATVADIARDGARAVKARRRLVAELNGRTKKPAIHWALGLPGLRPQNESERVTTEAST